VLNCKHDERGIQYGILPLRDSLDWRDTSSLIVFGGENLSNGRCMKMTQRVEFCNQNVEKSTMTMLRSRDFEGDPIDKTNEFEELTVKDRFYFA
jgi:hypothetical protein